MSEYIVCVDDLEESYYRYTDIKPETVFGHRLREEIVRCRDCEYFLCLWIDGYVCKRNGKKFMPWIDPDGFCAWAERREP